MRKFLIGLAAIGLLLGGGLISLMLPGRCPVTRQACDRIKEGMTRAEAEAILGGPPGDYRTGPEPFSFLDFSETSGPITISFLEWRGDEGKVTVLTEYPGDLVTQAFFQPRVFPQAGPVERLLWRLGRFVDRWDPKPAGPGESIDIE